jgi:REP element-mobilizing transposase RayT
MNDDWKRRPVIPKPQPRADGTPPGWYSRGYLPHFDGGPITQGVTFRLFDSLPKPLIARWQQELSLKPEKYRAAQLRKRVDAYLDRGVGAAWMKEKPIADKVQESLLHFDGARYRLHAWVVMSNHVHVVLTPIEGWELSQILHSWRSYTAKECNKLLGRTGRFWWKDAWDRFVRDERHYFSAIRYIEYNPVKAGLCKKPEDWEWSSARTRAEKIGGSEVVVASK